MSHAAVPGNDSGQYQPFLEALERNWPPEAALARRQTHGYDRETCLLFGQWMLQSVTEVYGPQQRITREMISLASKHGFGPSDKPIKHHFGGALWRYNEALGTMYGRAVGRYGDWEEEDFLDYGQRVILRHGIDKPSQTAFDVEFSESRGPSMALIVDRFGEKGLYFERLGYVNTKKWEPEDYVRWGADVLASGIGLGLSASTVDRIAKFRMGPSDKAVYRNYGSLVNLQSAALAAVQGYTDDMVEDASRRFGVYRFETSEPDDNAAREFAFSARLRLITSEGSVLANLSPPAAILLKILLNHLDAPVYREDFFEAFIGDGRSRADAAAFEELQALAFLSKHLVSLEVGQERVYGLSAASDDISLLIRRAETAALYFDQNRPGFVPEAPVDGTEHPFRRAVTLSALGLAAAGASALYIRRNRLNK